jgi:hypothetical protein
VASFSVSLKIISQVFQPVIFYFIYSHPYSLYLNINGGTWPRFSPSFNKSSRDRHLSAGTLSKSYLDILLICLFWAATWPPQCICQTYVNMIYIQMVLDTFVAWRTAKVQPSSCQTDFCLLCWASCWGTVYNVRQDKSHRGHHYGWPWPGFSSSFNKASRDRHGSAGIRTPDRALYQKAI